MLRIGMHGPLKDCRGEQADGPRHFSRSMSSARNIAWVRLKDAWAQRHLRIAVHEKAGFASQAVKRLAGFLMEQAAAEP